MFKKILIANRGAIACRIIRTAHRLGIQVVAIYSDADRHALHVRQADEAVHVGAAAPAESYLDQQRIITAALATGAAAIHPGYGFLSENAGFAEACAAAGLVFVGPTPQQMRDFGLKHRARELAAANAVPLLPGSALLQDLDTARREAARIGYPVMLKSTAGGGGIGLMHCADETALSSAFEAVQRLARSNFSDGGVFLEKFVARARHIEVQLFGDGAGTVVTLGERDCSVQRRNQKVIEETPAPHLSGATRAALQGCARRLGTAVAYQSAGTVEFVYDADTQQFYFLEVNTRLQVEHGVTEEVYGVDLVEWMIRQAAGDALNLATFQPAPRGHALQVRLYAEDPARNFRPSSGLIAALTLPQHTRVDGWIEAGTEVPAMYDPMLAKIICHAGTREAARLKLLAELRDTAVYGIETNLDYLRFLLDQPHFIAGDQTTRWLSALQYTSATIEVLQPGALSTLQDHPGRMGYWEVGVPPSGPMDALAFQLVNRMLGNAEDAVALELTVNGPTLRFACDCVIALGGAPLRATLDEQALPWWAPVAVPAGSVLKLGAMTGAGQRSYLAVKGGFDAPAYLGSCATFTLGQFGGHAGRALRAGDVLRLKQPDGSLQGCTAIAAQAIPGYSDHWQIGVLHGPHSAPEFFTPADIETFFATDWQVHYNSSRTGVRLVGPKPEWARSDGGEAGLHPSNIHDNAYAIGAIDYTGDMPVILGPDGPSLGGFVCPVTIALAELWKIGQLRPGDRIRFHAIDAATARAQLEAQRQLIRTLGVHDATGNAPVIARAIAPSDAVLLRLPASARHPEVCVRQSGDDNLLVEFGALVLDIELRCYVQALYEWLRTQSLPALIDLTPGIRSLQLHFDCRCITQEQMLHQVLRGLEQLPGIDELELPSRIVHLPLSWDDPATRVAIERYMGSVRADAPWCPSNIEFIRRINGLDSIDDVYRTVFDASYLVMGLGDVYLGAPVATPLDPRHRLVTTKYNPARTWTPENAVGIGGAYLCVYGMEGPGGYQFVGRTVQMWNRYRSTREFEAGKPWLLRCFDQIRFHPVSPAQLLELRERFPYGLEPLRIEPARFRLGDYRRFLAEQADDIAAFRARQRAAFEAERERWRSAGLDRSESEAQLSATPAATEIPDDCIAVSAPLTGSLWQVRVQPGQSVRAGDELMVLEAMKMEFVVRAEEAGVVEKLCVSSGRAVTAGETLLVFRPQVAAESST
ncbi:MAG: urea carboxylase [Steroidobacteraceae bacterium]